LYRSAPGDVLVRRSRGKLNVPYPKL